MKGICHIWSRGRHFSPSLPGDRYLKLGSKSDLRAEISGSIVRYNALAPCPEVLRLFFCLYANPVCAYACASVRELQLLPVTMISSLHMRSLPRVEFRTICVEDKNRIFN